MKKETFFGLAMLSLAGCSTTSQQTAALDVQPLELESLKPEKIQPVKRVFAGNPARNRLIADGKKLIGTRYRYGGTSEKSGFDCSGLVKYCYAVAGYNVSHSSRSLRAYCSKPASQAVAGDIVWRPGHVGICIGGGKTIEAMSPSQGVTFGSTSSFSLAGSPA